MAFYAQFLKSLMVTGSALVLTGAAVAQDAAPMAAEMMEQQEKGALQTEPMAEEHQEEPAAVIDPSTESALFATAGDVSAQVEPMPDVVAADSTPPEVAPTPQVSAPVSESAAIVNAEPGSFENRPNALLASDPESSTRSSQDEARRIIELLVVGQEGEQMPMQTALNEAYVKNPTIRASRAEVKATYEALPQAWSGWQPTVAADGTIEYQSTETDPGAENSGTERSLGLSLSQPLYRGGRTVAETKAAQAVIDAQLATLATTERSVLYRVAQSYMDVLRDQAVLRVNQKNRDVIAQQLQATRDRFRVGDLTRTDVSQSEFRLARAEADVASAAGALQTTRAVFEQLVGQAPGTLTLPEFVPMALPENRDAAISIAETYNPDVIAALATHEAAEHSVDIEKSGLLPQVSLSSGLSRSYDASAGLYDTRDAGAIGVTASLSLYQGGAVRSRIREAKYTANQRYMQILEVKRAAREETVRAWENLQAALAEMESRTVQVRAAEIASSGVHQEADLGSRTILDTLDADQEVRDAQVALISAKRNEVVARFALASAMGLLTPGNVGIEQPAFDFEAYAAGLRGRILSTSVETEDETVP